MVRRLSPGALRHKVVIEARDGDGDGRGGRSTTWTQHAEVFASIRPASSREAFEHGQVAGARTHVITTRFASGVVPAMRVVFDTRVFEIVGVRVEDERRRVLLLDCVEERI